MTQDPTSQLDTGALFGERYRIVRCIRTGGMGAVYEAVHGETGRRVALKVMLPSLVADPGLRARFKLEATVAASVESEHIVDVFDAGIDTSTGAPFLVMELLRGEDVSTILKQRGPFGPEDAVQLLWQAALALDKTHASGIIHRDLKPDNLYLTERDDGSPRLKILDFGIAKVMAHNPAGAQQTATVGTPLYMAPEQISGEPIGPAADLYSLGHIAYALLVGRSYWSDDWGGGPIYPLLLKVLKGSNELASSRAARHDRPIPPGFDGWFAHATALGSGNRFRSATEMVEALAEALGVGAPTQRRQRKAADSGADLGRQQATGSGTTRARHAGATRTVEGPTVPQEGAPPPSVPLPPAPPVPSGPPSGQPSHPAVPTPASSAPAFATPAPVSHASTPGGALAPPSAPPVPSHLGDVPSAPSIPHAPFASAVPRVDGWSQPPLPTPPSGVNFSVPTPQPLPAAAVAAEGPVSPPHSGLRRLLAASLLAAALVAAGGLLFAFGREPAPPATSAATSPVVATSPGVNDAADPVAASAVASVAEPPEVVPSASPASSASAAPSPSARPLPSGAPVRFGNGKRFPTPDPVGTSFY